MGLIPLNYDPVTIEDIRLFLAGQETFPIRWSWLPLMIDKLVAQRPVASVLPKRVLHQIETTIQLP